MHCTSVEHENLTTDIHRTVHDKHRSITLNTYLSSPPRGRPPPPTSLSLPLHHQHHRRLGRGLCESVFTGPFSTGRAFETPLPEHMSLKHPDVRRAHYTTSLQLSITTTTKEEKWRDGNTPRLFGHLAGQDLRHEKCSPMTQLMAIMTARSTQPRLSGWDRT